MRFLGSRFGISALLLILAGSSSFATPATTYYTGTHICDGKGRYDTWRALVEDGIWRVDASFRRQGSSGFDQLQLTGQITGSELVLGDKNGRATVAITVAGDKLRALWLDRDGRPDVDCLPFELAKGPTPTAHFDQLFALLEANAPAPADAREVGQLARTRPTIELLPTLDQGTYRGKFQQLSDAFWERYRKTTISRISEMPLTTPAGRDELLDFARSATGFDITPEDSFREDSKAVSFAYQVLETVTDRLDAAGQKLPELLGKDAKAFCTRAGNIYYMNAEGLSVVVGLPIEYWTRTMAEEILGYAGSCEAGESTVSLLTNNWAEIEKRQSDIVWIKAQRDQLIALPNTLEALRNSNWLTLDRDQRRVDSDLYARFAKPALDKRRQEMVEASIAQIDKIFSDATEATLSAGQAEQKCKELLGNDWGDVASELRTKCTARVEVYVTDLATKKMEIFLASISDTPKTLEGLKTHNWFELDTEILGDVRLPESVTATLEERVAPLRAQAISGATAEIEKAAATADPLSKELPSVLQMCNELPFGGFTDPFQTLRSTCNNAVRDFQDRSRSARCNAAIEASEAQEEMLDSTIEIESVFGSQNIKLRDLICRANENDVKVTFPTSGWIWKSQNIEIHGPKRSEPIRGTLKQAGEQSAGDPWRLVSIDSIPDELKTKMPPRERLLLCVYDQMSCPVH